MIPHNGVDTSVQAAASMVKSAPVIREEVFDYIKRNRFIGATCDEVEIFMKLRHQTASARIYELHKANRIYDTGERRKTRTGRKAIVWKAHA